MDGTRKGDRRGNKEDEEKRKRETRILISSNPGHSNVSRTEFSTL